MILIHLTLLVLFVSAMIWGFSSACRFEDYGLFDDASIEDQKEWPEPKQDDKMIFWFIRYYGMPRLGKYWSKPVFSCVICMASLHSVLPTAIYFTYMGLEPLHILIMWPFIVLAIAGVNSFLAFNFQTN